MVIINEVKAYSCPKCPRDFNLKSELDTHMQMAHSINTIYVPTGTWEYYALLGRKVVK